MKFNVPNSLFKKLNGSNSSKEKAIDKNFISAAKQKEKKEKYILEEKLRRKQRMEDYYKSLELQEINSSFVLNSSEKLKLFEEIEEDQNEWLEKKTP